MECSGIGFSRRGLLFGLFAFALGGQIRAEDERPVVDDRGVAREAAASGKLPTLWIAGDSTVKSNAPQRGWGQDLEEFFDPAKINVVNRAIGGRSSRTFHTEGRWQEILDAMKPGDFVVIQFGHNDVGPTDGRSKFRGSVKGIGDEVEIVTKPDGSTEEVRTYGWYLRNYVRTARAKGGKVVLCSPVPHKAFDDKGRFVRGWAEWRGWIREVAKAEGAVFVDLNELISLGYDGLERGVIEAFYQDARTHTTPEGSRFNARALVSGLRAIPTAPFDKYLSNEGMKVPARRIE